MTELRSELIFLPGVKLGGDNPLPFFRDPAVSRPIKVREPFPDDKREYLGWETAFRVLPYRMQDQYSRDKQIIDFRAVVLENEILKATFLPEVGGRLISLIYKPQIRELLHRNPVFQPANLAIRNAWFSGGIEWNIGQYGHTFSTCAPVFAAAIQGAQGEPGLRIYDYERCKGLFWQIDFYLPPGCPFLTAYTRVVNPNQNPVAMYWWTNVAVDERPGVRVLSPAKEAIYAAFESGGASFGLTEMPGLPTLKGGDGTYSLNSTFANEFFFQCESEMPWETALDENGRGFYEASTSRLNYRKLFCWGTHAGGRHWQEFLAQPGEAYLEIQAGLAPTQVHGLPMPAQSSWDWTQVFGYLEVPADKVHGEWQGAVNTVNQVMQNQISPNKIKKIEAQFRQRADQPSMVILQSASGWGALELHRRLRQSGAQAVLKAFVFPEATLGTEQEKWLALLEQGILPEQDVDALPGEWMVQADWELLLAQSPIHWYVLLHLGVMWMERLDEAGAEAAWLESIRLKPSAWAYRNLAILSLRRGKTADALEYYEKAWACALKGTEIPAALAVEYLEKLVETQQWERGMRVYNELPHTIRATDRVQILRGQFALELGDLDAVEQVLEREYAVVREGETILTDLWFEMQARRAGISRAEALTQYPPPSRIDFRGSMS